MKQSFQIKGETKLCFKIVLLGSSSVGKTSIIRRFLKNEFAMKSMSTVGVACESKVINVNNQTVKVQLWDTAGQERFRSLTKNYYRGCDAVIIVYDVSSMKSFDQVNGWIADFDDKCEKQAIKMLLGNKIDLTNKEVSTELAQVYAKRKRLQLQEVSAKENINIENAIHSLIEILIQSQQIQSDTILRRGSLVEGRQINSDISNSQMSKTTRVASYKPPETNNNSHSEHSKHIKSDTSQEESPSISGPVLPPQTPPTIIVSPPEEVLIQQEEKQQKFKKKDKLLLQSTLSVPLKLMPQRESDARRDEYFLRHGNQGCLCC